MSDVPWRNGTLEPKVTQFIYIAHSRRDVGGADPAQGGEAAGVALPDDRS